MRAALVSGSTALERCDAITASAVAFVFLILQIKDQFTNTLHKMYAGYSATDSNRLQHLAV